MRESIGHLRRKAMCDTPAEGEGFRPSVIALDFDETFTADPLLWSLFAQVATWRGHTVICVTARRGKFFEERQEVVEALPKCVAAYFAYDTPKRTYMAQLGVEVDIWIDDTPEGI